MSNSQSPNPPLFELGKTAITKNANAFLKEQGINPLPYLMRHAYGDWSDMPADDQARNKRAITEGSRILSSYNLPDQDERLWVITEADRSLTTILLPEDY